MKPNVSPTSNKVFQSSSKHKNSIFRMIILLILTVMCIAAACQPTPDEPIIVNKNDGSLEQALAQSSEETGGDSSAPEAYNAPSHWTQTHQRGKLTVEVDTNVILPDVKAYLVKTVQPVSFSQERVNQMVDYFAKGKKLYEMPHIMCKSDYNDWLIEAKRGQEIDGEYVVNEGSLAWVRELEQRIAEAPEVSPKIYTDATLTYMRNGQDGSDLTAYGPNFVHVAVDSGDHTDTMISVSNHADKNKRDTSFMYWRGSNVQTQSWCEEILEQELDFLKMYPENPDPYAKKTIEHYQALLAVMEEVVISPEDAQQQAQTIIDDFGIKGLTLLSSEKAVISGFEPICGVDNTMPDRSGYQFRYVRSCEGILAYEAQGSYSSSDGEEPPAYVPPFEMETLTVFVSEYGIDFVNWQGASEIVETVSDHVPLLAFDKIQQALLDQIYYKKSFWLERDNTDTESETVYVRSAALHMGYIPVKDDPHKAMLIPVWVFETDEETTIKNPVGDGETRTLPGNHEQYVLSAIDGGVIGPWFLASRE